ncbi:MAG: ATP synthase F1 subunit gamma [Bacteroidaceae bacterium]|nr:ATP synthase F1 subunit gamma [Bacteroidaceae bacterium]
MSSLKEIKGRIASVRNTQKITSAMRMVASAKLHHTQSMTEAFLRYKDELGKIVDSLQLTVDSSMRQEDQQGESQLSTFNSQTSTLLIPVSSNSGLCGAFNSNIAKATMKRIQELESQGQEVHLLPIGKKIAHDLKKANKDFNADFVDMHEKIEKSSTFTDVSSLVNLACALHQNKKIDNVEFLYHHFKSMGSQIITIDSLSLTSNLSPLTSHLSLLTEPSPQELLTSLFPRLLNAQVYGILLDSLTSEHAARMLAMQTADDNANDLLKELTLLYNKTRQQSITNELIDIMSGQIGKQ